MDMLKEEERAVAYLNAALDEPDPRIFLVALRNVTQAHGGMGKIAAHSGLNRESLYRALSEKGNPNMQTLAAVLRAIGARLGVARVKETGVRLPLGSFTATTRVQPIFSWSTTSAGVAEQLMAA
jgi:probable addiction module antidote protein